MFSDRSNVSKNVSNFLSLKNFFLHPKVDLGCFLKANFCTLGKSTLREGGRMLERLAHLPWVSHLRSKNFRAYFKSGERLGEAVETKQGLLVSLRFTAECKSAKWIYRVMTVLALQETVEEQSLHADAANNLWLNFSLLETFTQERWSKSLFFHLALMDYFELQLAEVKTLEKSVSNKEFQSWPPFCKNTV